MYTETKGFCWVYPNFIFYSTIDNVIDMGLLPASKSGKWILHNEDAWPESKYLAYLLTATFVEHFAEFTFMHIFYYTMDND